MKNIFAMLCAIALLVACERKTQDRAETVANIPAPTPVENASLSQDQLLERGKYLVAIGSCNDCHSPKDASPEKGKEGAPDPNRLMSGHPATEKLPPLAAGANNDGWVRFSMGSTAMVGPWGTSFAANLTPDPTGIGNWTLDNFKTALREGKYKGMENNRNLLPPMPWPNYQSMTDQDVEAIFTYLKSLPPVKNVVPAPIPPAAS
ncbi:c-type cytochrome [Nibribacter koreensis]|uniref:C-type cytochrome n=1 Tax=Nibribacter koreensis TaxID=1084519 RepID=A0ABP8FQ37_9BACT